MEGVKDFNHGAKWYGWGLKGITYLTDLLFPTCCLGCGDSLVSGEVGICLRCEFEIPKTRFHVKTPNEAEQLFWGLVPISHVLCYWYFDKESRVQEIMHGIKYYNFDRVAFRFGQIYARELNAVHHPIIECDCLIPIPLSRKKLKRRGYNQSAEFAKGLAKILNIPVLETALIKSSASTSLVGKGREDRFNSLELAFQIGLREGLENKKVVLVDDVLTSGATIVVCAQKLLEAGVQEVSVITLARKRN